MDSNLLKRYFSNIYSKKDYQIIRNEFHKGTENPNLSEQMKEQWMEFDDRGLPEVQFEQVLDKLHHRINIENKVAANIFSFWKLAQRVAAILFLPLLIGSFVYNGLQNKKDKLNASWAEIQCPLGVRTKFQLPDGSTGYLNSGSKLRYPVSFAQNRNVTLVGEGFFDVAKDEKNPFHVRTQNLDIKVLGTSFNVSAYADDKMEEVVLQTGHIEVSDANGIKIASIKPEQEFFLDKRDLKFSLNKVESEQYTCWKEGKLIFRNENIEDMAVRLSRWYNVEVIVDKSNSHIKTYTYHGTFVDEHLDDVLKLLSLTSNISAVQKERVKGRDGNYTRRKVILSINQNKFDEFEKKN